MVHSLKENCCVLCPKVFCCPKCRRIHENAVHQVIMNDWYSQFTRNFQLNYKRQSLSINQYFTSNSTLEQIAESDLSEVAVIETPFQEKGKVKRLVALYNKAVFTPYRKFCNTNLMAEVPQNPNSDGNAAQGVVTSTPQQPNSEEEPVDLDETSDNDVQTPQLIPVPRLLPIRVSITEEREFSISVEENAQDGYTSETDMEVESLTRFAEENLSTGAEGNVAGLQGLPNLVQNIESTSTGRRRNWHLINSTSSLPYLPNRQPLAPNVDHPSDDSLIQPNISQGLEGAGSSGSAFRPYPLHSQQMENPVEDPHLATLESESCSSSYVSTSRAPTESSFDESMVDSPMISEVPLKKKSKKKDKKEDNNDSSSSNNGQDDDTVWQSACGASNASRTYEPRSERSQEGDNTNQSTNDSISSMILELAFEPTETESDKQSTSTESLELKIKSRGCRFIPSSLSEFQASIWNSLTNTCGIKLPSVEEICEATMASTSKRPSDSDDSDEPSAKRRKYDPVIKGRPPIRDSAATVYYRVTGNPILRCDKATQTDELVSDDSSSDEDK